MIIGTLGYGSLPYPPPFRDRRHCAVRGMELNRSHGSTNPLGRRVGVLSRRSGKEQREFLPADPGRGLTLSGNGGKRPSNPLEQPVSLDPQDNPE